MVITQKEVLGVVENLKWDGNFFTVKFKKRTTGEVREMNCRGGVSAYVKGTGLAFDPAKKNLLSVWEANNKEGAKGAGAYRFISLDGVMEVKGKGQVWTVEKI